VNKQEAEVEALRLWHALPPENRSDIVHALAFAQLIAKTLPFDTLGQHDKIVQAWLVRDLQRTSVAPVKGRRTSAQD
jgi:hypothetical protein